MQMLQSDPELAAGLQNPKIMKAFSSMMGGGGETSPELEDPEVKAYMEKLQEKLGPLMGMMGGGMGGEGVSCQHTFIFGIDNFMLDRNGRNGRYGRYGWHGWYGWHGRHGRYGRYGR